MNDARFGVASRVLRRREFADRWPTVSAPSRFALALYSVGLMRTPSTDLSASRSFSLALAKQ